MRIDSSERLRGDNGAVVIEFALVLPFLTIVFLGIIEYGMLFRQYDVLSGVMQSVGRTDSNLATDRYADYSAILTMRAGLTQLKKTQVDYAIIFKAPQGGLTATPPPAACITMATINGIAYMQPQGIANVCNVFSRAQINAVNPVSYDPGFKCLGGPCTSPSSVQDCQTGGIPNGAWDQFWCPFARKNGMSDNAGAGPDLVGVYVSATYTNMTKIVPGTTRTISQQTVFRLEPVPG